MGRPPGNGTPAFRFSSTEVAEMEMILREHKAQVPSREILESLAEKFSASQERSGKNKVQVKQVWNWFQNRRFALRAKQTNKPPEMFSAPPPLPRFNAVNNFPQAQNAAKNVPQAPQPVNPPVGGGKPVSDNSSLEFEAKSARDGAWYDVASFLSHRALETDEPDVLVRFAGFGSEEDEWVNVRKHVRPRSLPCESTECVAILPKDLILCFQEGKEQALYYDAHVIDSQRRRHDVRGCRCRFLVRYDHDQSEEIVPLRKVCRRPETDYRLLQLQSMNDSGATKQKQKMTTETSHMGNTLRVYPPSEQIMPKPQKAEESHGSRSNSTELKIEQTKNPKISQKADEFLSHGYRSISAELKTQQIKNPKIGPDTALNIPPVPPGFEAVTSGTVRSDTHVAAEQRSLETINDEVVTPVATEVPSIETKNPEVITPKAPEVKTLEMNNPEVGAGGDVETSIVPPEFEAANTTIAVEVDSLQTQNPEVGTGDAGKTSTVLPSNDDLKSGDVADSTVGVDTPAGPVVKSLDIEVSASDAVNIPIVPPGFEVVTSNNSSIAPVVKSPVAKMSETEALNIPIVPPGFETVISGDTPMAMKAESPQKGNPEVIGGDVGVTLTVPSINETVTCDADTSIAMDVDSLQIKDAEINAGNAAETSTVLSKEGLTSVATVDNNDNDSTENMVEG